MTTSQHIRFISCIMSILMQGCASNTDRANALQVWRSPKSNQDQLVEAVQILVPLKTKPGEAIKILGPGGAWVHWHGPTFFAYAHPNQELETREPTPHDYCTLEYPTSGGSISLMFSTAKGGHNFNEYRFVSVGFCETGGPATNRGGGGVASGCSTNESVMRK